MKKVQAKSQFTEKNSTAERGMQLGRIVQVNKDGQVLVDYFGNTCGALAARTTSSVQAALRKGNPTGREVLLIFENNDPKHPIIVDTMYSLIDEITENSTAALKRDADHEKTINRPQVIARECDEVVLRCGKASITLTRAGKILIKGEYILSSATGVNKIRGGSVHLN